ncbi:hypothetical protein N476_23435 [Pseudoalteromonas luteoviolacea H33]|uniref:DUF2802 domain-containing protein n=2 Tax=Pseudoalteromonas luteoviolacea TaxID=43657 RepID=A0A167C1I9_9GAMM|nr:DUF2802 domain-containing protein [Pseudoalteromonas luteoviolacea]KZN47134.1 hypothetical protein N476_23435 [Pseudoalteromonas luteoviolacea H33]KZN77250.1 hypothetical protein N477_12755 [Pseudoalteromonas luteoviolacea H33-S]
MAAVNLDDVLIALMVVSCVVSLTCLGLLFLFSKRLQQTQNNAARLHKQSHNDAEQISILRSEIAEVRASVLSIGKRLVECETFTKDLAQQQAAQKYDDPDAKIYSRAVKMVELGADLEEIMRECELPRAEAELLMSLHNKSQ